MTAIGSPALSTASTITTGSWSRPISTPMPRPSASVDALWRRQAGVVCEDDPQHGRMGWFSSDRTIRAICKRHLESWMKPTRARTDEGTDERHSFGRRDLGDRCRLARRPVRRARRARESKGGLIARCFIPTPRPSPHLRFRAGRPANSPVATTTGFFEGRLKVAERQPLRYHAAQFRRGMGGDRPL